MRESRLAQDCHIRCARQGDVSIPSRRSSTLTRRLLPRRAIAACWWSQRLLDLVSLRCRVVAPPGFAFDAARPIILMSNHQSLYDIPLIFVALPGSIRMLTKRELFRIPIWGRGMKAAEFISIDRRDRRQARRDLARHGANGRRNHPLGGAGRNAIADGRLGELKKRLRARDRAGA
jgi:1-acyl-sn-glycerol-3-phosphate acyltransferase